MSEDMSNVFCCFENNKVFLPPTTTSHWRKAPDNIIHYDGCCSIYNELKKKEKEERIKYYLYQCKVNDWKCHHTKEYYDEKFNKANVNKEKFAPPPLIFNFAWPECCMNDHDLTYSRMKQKSPPIQVRLEDAMSDPDVIKQFDDYMNKFE